jgi:hypothetical protein
MKLKMTVDKHMIVRPRKKRRENYNSGIQKGASIQLECKTS